MSRTLRIIFNEENLRELLFNGESKIDDVTFSLNGEHGWNSVGVSDYNINELVEGKITTSNGLYGLKVEYILSDIGYDKIYKIVSKYKMGNNG